MDEQERYDEICKPQFEHIDKKLDRILGCLEGNNETVGLKTRIDRLESISKVICWITGAWVLSFIGLICGWIFNKITKPS